MGILDDLISDGDEDESDEEQLEDEVSEEIVQNEIEDAGSLTRGRSSNTHASP